MLLPFPHAIDEGLPTDIPAAYSLAGELALHHKLGRDTGMVGARQPEGGNPLHALPTDDDVNLRMLQHVAHVKAAGHVRGWKRQGKRRRRGTSRRRFDVEQFFLDPVIGPARLNGAGVVGLGKIVRHSLPFETNRVTSLILQDRGAAKNAHRTARPPHNAAAWSLIRRDSI